MTHGVVRTQSVWPSIGGTAMGKKIGRGLVAKRLEECTQLRMSVCHLQTQLIVSHQYASTTCSWLGERSVEPPCGLN